METILINFLEEMLTMPKIKNNLRGGIVGFISKNAPRELLLWNYPQNKYFSDNFG